MSFRANIERAIFGTTLDEVMDSIRVVSRRVDDISMGIDENVALVRRGIRRLDTRRAEDVRDGLYIVEDDCISCEVCVDLSPEVYRMRDDGVAVVHAPYATNMDKLQETIESCGGSCIKLAG